MSSRRKRLLNRQAAIMAEQRALLDTADEEDRTKLSEEEDVRYLALGKELQEEVEPALAQEVALLEREKELAGKLTLSLSGEPEKKEKLDITFPVGVKHSQAPRGFDDAEHAYRCGQWARAKLFGHESAQQWCRDYAPEFFVQTESVNIKGGFLVPDEFARTIINLQEEYGVFRANSLVWPMASDSTLVPRRTGGLTTYWVGEETATTASDMSFDQVTLTARKLGTLTRYSTELADDAVVSIAGIIADEVARAFASKEDDCGFLGDGTSTYGGIVGLITKLTAATASTVTPTAGATTTSFGALLLVNFESMIGKLPMFPGIQPKWYISKAGWAASMMRLADAAGGNTTANIGAGVGPTFLGYPVVFSQKMNSTLTAQASTHGLCYLGDLAMASTMGVRRAITIKTTEERYIEYDQIGLLATERFDINVHDVGDTSSAGPMIGLATPAN